MKEHRWYNLVFMFLITAFFSFILVGIHVYTQPIVEKNVEIANKSAYLTASNIGVSAGARDPEIEDIYSSRITNEKKNGMEFQVFQDEAGKVSGYGFKFEGSGLWGNIKGIIGLSSDLQKVLGLDFTEQNETPGLGGRIDEAWFKEQFRNVKLQEGAVPLQYGEVESQGQLDAITGATITSDAVMRIVNEKILEVREKLGGGL